MILLLRCSLRAIRSIALALKSPVTSIRCAVAWLNQRVDVDVSFYPDQDRASENALFDQLFYVSLIDDPIVEQPSQQRSLLRHRACRASREANELASFGQALEQNAICLGGSMMGLIQSDEEMGIRQ